MATVTHEVIFNVESGQYTVSPSLDIPQGDYNSHIINIKLRNNEDEFVSITDTCSVLVSFTNAEGKLIVSDAVTIVNAYRGELSYVIGKAIVSEIGRYVMVVNLSNSICTNCYCCGDNMSLKLVVNINLNGSSVTSDSLDYEVSISKSFYDELVAHLKNELIHVGEKDRHFLDLFRDRCDELEALLGDPPPTPPDPDHPLPPCPCRPVHQCPYNLRLINHEVPSEDSVYVELSFPEILPNNTKVGDYLLGINGYVARIVDISYELEEISNLRIKGIGVKIFDKKSVETETTDVVNSINFSATSFEIDGEVLVINNVSGSYGTTSVVSSVNEVDNSHYPVQDNSNDEGGN